MATVESAERLVSLPTVIETRLQDVRRRESRLRLFTGLVDATSVFLVIMLVALICDWAFTLFSTEVRLVLSLGTVAAGVVGLLLLAFLPLLKRRTLAEVAADVDRSVSELQERWQTVAELSSSNDPKQVAGSPAMARRVVREAVSRERLVDAQAVVTTETLKKHQWFLVAAIAAHVLLYVVDAPQAWVLLQRFLLPTSNVSLTQVTAAAGNFAVPHGEPVRLEANLARRNQDSAELFIRDAAGKVLTISLKSADKAGSKFVYGIDAADKGFDYRFRAGDGETPWHSVAVHERPTFSKIDFRITPPEYTKLPVVEKQELPGKIRAIEGSQLEIVFTADQPLSQFRIDFGKDESTILEPNATDPQKFLYQTKLDKTIRLTPVMTSKFDLENVHPPSCQIVVYPDRKPQVQIVTPDNEITVRPDDQVTIEIAARDDLGVVEAEVIAYVGDAPDMENAVVVEPSAETPASADAKVEEPTGINTMQDLINAIQDAAQPGADPNSLKIDTTTVDPNAAPAAEGTTEPGKDAPPAEGEAAQSATSKPTQGTTDSKPSTDAKPSADAKDAKGAGDKNSATDGKPAADGKRSTDSKPSDANSKPQSNDASTKPGDSNSQNSANKDSNSNSSNSPNSQNANPNVKPGTNSANNNASANQNQNSSSATPPQTIRMQIPLGNQKGEKSVRGKVKLDLSQFKLKTGQQLQYKVLVKDTSNAVAQNRDRNAMGAESQNRLAQNDPNRNAQQTDPTSGQPGNPPNAAGNAQNPNDPSGAQNANANANDGKMSNANNSAQARQNGGSANNAQKMQNANGGQNSQNATDPSTASQQNANGDGNNNNRNNNANPSDNKSNPNDNSSGSSGQNQANRSSKNSDKDQQQQGSMTGAAPPPNSMTRRDLDVDQPSASSSTMKIHIDEWAGSFKGQQREKLEILIDPIMKELDAVLAKSLEHMNPAADVLKQGKPLDDAANKSLKAADTQIERGQTLVADLVKKTTDTPYAFVGLQLVDITEVHVVPARGELKAVSTDAADKQKTHVGQAQFHVIRAREMLANLTKKYEQAKQNAKLADKMQRIRKMYQIFIEDSAIFLAATRDTLNPKSRNIAELELDEEFLEKYTELQKEWNEILKQLAKALAEDPRLLERYMNSSRKSAMTLRDQLTVVNQRQQLLVPVTDRLLDKKAEQAKTEEEPAEEEDRDSKKPAGKKEKKEQPSAADVVKGSLQEDLIEVSEKASEIHEDLKAWLPKTMKTDDARVAPLVQQSTQVATIAEQAAAAASLKSLEAAAKKVTELNTQMAEFEQGLSKLTGDSDAALTANVNRRLAALRRLQLRTSAWAEKNTHLNEGNLNKAIEIDQHRVSEETLELAGKLDGLQATFAGLPDDILELAGSLQEILRFDALVDQMQAELTLRDNDLPVARDHQQNAVKNLTRAEETADKLIDRIIEEQDKVPPDVPDVDQMQLPTLEELLAQLEAERDLAEEFGIPQRPTNLQQFRDWMMRNMGGAGGAGANRASMARLNALRALQNANVPDGNKLPTKKAKRWNTLSSRLEDILRQGRGKLPPKQYQRAIDQYFNDISGAEGSEDPAK